jgi:hypothetical protein
MFSRRTVITSTAAALPLATAPIAAAASGEDPIFAAIERDRIAYRAFIARCEHEDATETLNDTPEMDAVLAASMAARRELANTAPTTTAGLNATYGILQVEGEANFSLSWGT